MATGGGTTPARKLPDSRVGRLRERIINAPQEVSIERARYLTRSMKNNWDRHPLERISMAFSDVLDNISVVIHDDELIVGSRTEKLKGAPLFPENKMRWIEGDVDNFDTRVLQRALITEKEKKEITDDILPFWEGKSVEYLLEERLPEDVGEDMDKYIFTMMLEITYGIGHFTMDHDMVLSIGLSGVIARAREKFDALSAQDKEGKKGILYQAMIRSMEAVIRHSHRYAEKAARMAETEKDPVRKEELKKIAEICKKVPEHPAETFHEAVQAVYFIHLMSQLESGGNSISLGRIDRILQPYYDRDRETGAVDYEQAVELLSLMFLKTNEIWNVLEEAFIPGGEGTEGKTTQNVIVGGVDEDGNDATTELSFAGLDAFAKINTVQPNFGVRINKNTPHDFLTKAADYVRDGVLMHFHNDDAIIPTLIEGGHTPADARNYGVVGCLEPNAQGKTFGSTFAVQFNGIKCMEFALSGGIDNTFGYQSGLETGDPADFTSFEDVWDAYASQVSHFIGQMVKGMNVLDEILAENVPSPFASAMIEGAMDKGIDVTSGGAVYNSTGVQYMGFANVADSLYAVKKAVFEDNVLTIGELAEMLSDDWTDTEEKRAYFLKKLPKFGNDVDEVDEMAAKVLTHFCDVLATHKNYRGGAFWPGVFSVGFHLAMGSFTAATPDGRASGDILGNGLTPTTGNALKGPTSVVNSITKLPLTRIFNGANLNLRLPGKNVGTDALSAFIRTYFEKGGLQVQFNMVDSDTLRNAQKNPDNYRDLVVRISGYSVLFTGLSDTAQDEIISRTEYNL
ncbi:MAG: formate C-acetyltransferase/glycerol dehydratase family glycyl radical enzyme [Deltaproteobacteria bacterium]|nr:formate C-acetyltransferase/glycerol dehydratase family glycyl radical enzyme [Candidatus Zymogenaceae bacterium]